MKKEFKIDNMRKAWITPKNSIQFKGRILFNRTLTPIGNHPIIIFQDEQNGDYFFLTFKTARKYTKQFRGEMKIDKEDNNLQDVNSFLDTTQIHWARKELFESIFANEEISYIRDVFTEKTSYEILKTIYKNIKERPPFISLMKLEYENDKVIPNLMYCNEKLFKMALDDDSSWDINMENEIKTKNEDFFYKIEQIAGQVYFESMEALRGARQGNPNLLLNEYKKEFPNVKDESLFKTLENGKNIYKDLNFGYDYFDYFKENEKQQWLTSNYGKFWKYDYDVYKQYQEFVDKQQFQPTIEKNNEFDEEVKKDSNSRKR